MADVIDRDGQWFIVNGDGSPVPGASEPHISREEAEAHIAAMTAETGEQLGKLQKFIPLAKVDEQKHEVWGYAAVEEPDHADEIMDYATSKPHWIDWSVRAQKRSGGRSLGNLRSMHKAIAAGKLIYFQPDDVHKGIKIGAEVVDEEEWKKVKSGTYTGFSVGGDYLKRWYDASFKKMRYTAKPSEVSLVDAPCIESATFHVVKADGLEEDRHFSPTNGENILKADLPDTPDAAGETALDDGVTVEMMPAQDLPMQVSPVNLPDSETMASRHVGVEDVSATAEEVIAESETVAKAEPAKNLIKVKPRRMVKVVQPERRLVKVVNSQKE